MSLAIVWFRRDLRLADNPALTEALADYDKVLPVYIRSSVRDAWGPGAAGDWWLHHALEDLQRALGGRLLLRSGDALATLRELIVTAGAEAVYWNRQYEPAAIARDIEIKQALRGAGVTSSSANASLLFEPWTVANKQGLPFRVFTPFWKCLLGLGLPDRPWPEPRLEGRLADPAGFKPLSIDELALLPTIGWDQEIAATWCPTREAATARLDEFLASTLGRYAEGRDLPGKDWVSRLSPYLHFGQIGPRELVAATPRGDPGGAAFLREVGWREFAYYQLYHFPHTSDAPMDKRFEDFPWREADDELVAWQHGRTGIPLVDAGMRELWATGWMHNRVRMVVASFLTKNLLLPWQDGARWFWDTLVDADLASNSLGWQWAAGSGADAAPYFRVFNPVLQGQKFDKQGGYTRRWVPELAGLPDKYLHQPWEASEDVLAQAGVRLGKDYPLPICDLKASRQRALAVWDQLKRR